MKGTSHKADPGQILLAPFSQECKRLCEVMPEVSKAWACATQPTTGTNLNHYFVAFCPVGLGSNRPIPATRGGVKFVIVAVNYFTKSVKVEAFTSITSQSVIKFLWKLVVCQFGIPQSFISDNERQFDCSHYQE